MKNARNDGSGALFTPAFPTLAELGYADIVFQDWLGLFAPAGTAAGTVARLNAALNETMNSESGQAGLAKLGMELALVAPEGYAQIVRADWERYRAIVRASGFKPED